MATDRTAEVTWNGSLMEGSGRIDSTTSGVLGQQELTWKARAEDGPGGTSPEDLIAAAHAACFAMALSHGLAQAGTPADEVKTSATVTFQPGEGITKIALTVDGRVPGIDEAAFRQAAEGAKENCPVSKALAAVPEITLETRFQG
ncbi:MAG TPA: OsmC family peroxiredoxin [Gaiellaceae bacterium]